ncbi:MAG: MMPL family transporter [Desulfatiglandales bacterium]
MQTGQSIVRYSIDHPKIITLIMVAMTIVLGALIPFVKVDTDPENMLSEKEAVRVFHNAMKREFTLHDMVILGVVNKSDPDGVFNPESLTKIYELTAFARGLRWPDPEDPQKEIGVIEIDLLAPSTVDNIETAGPGTVRFEWLMAEPPKTREEARKIRDNARNNPLLNGTLISEDGKALCLYLLLTSKDLSYRVYSKLKEKIATMKGNERYFITGLPVAEDTFGVQMFIQMAISAPMAMLLIFILLFLFFRKLVIIVSPMIITMVSVICTMGLLIGAGYKVHIMSSMIPIFIMPIAVLDSIHILSEFFDRYQETRDSRATSIAVMEKLFKPMLYTSLTSAAGFASLALTPIPPVQVFGVFVAIGIMLAWALTITFIPAYTMFISKKSLESFGLVRHEKAKSSMLTRLLQSLGGFTYRRTVFIISITLATAAIAGYGISLVRINDNPVKWFEKSHPIRVADEVLNAHFGGTYMAYLVLEPERAEQDTGEIAGSLQDRLRLLKTELRTDFPEAVPVIEKAGQMVRDAAQEAASGADLIDLLLRRVANMMDTASEDSLEALEEVAAAFDSERAARQTFKRPDVLRYIGRLQDALLKTEVVGKSNAITDIVKKVYKELMEGKEAYYRIPDTPEAVAQCLISFQNSHDPDDLWHLVTPDYGKANVWVQLKSGDNRDMERVKQAVDIFFQKNPPPIPLKHGWFGLTYINVVWQNKMVSGMLKAFLGSFLVVFIMMAVLFRSPLWGALSMVPLTVTIAFIYGVIGFVGKDYDMPVAVLSALTLGLAVDFSIHFLARSRAAVQEHGSWERAVQSVFGEPARAISRNIIVIAIGFLPLLAAPLVPYKTVGMFMASILVISGIATLFILPALMRVLGRFLFPVGVQRS